MLYETEYPRVFSSSNIKLDILSKPIIWFKPYLTTIGQVLLYRLKIKPVELKTADQLDKKIIKLNDGSEIMVAQSRQSYTPRAIVLYLHTVCGNYTQLSHIAHVIKKDKLGYVTYTRSGNDSNLEFNKFNFVGRIEELQLVIKYINIVYPNVPIHAIGAR